MRVEELLKTLRREFIKVNLIQASLDSLIFFLSANLVSFVLSVRIVSAFDNIVVIAFLTLLFLVGDLVYRVHSYHLEIYEEQNPELREILRTARDNLDKQNIVSQALFDEVLDRARSVTSESIIPTREIVQKILAVGIISFITVMSGITNLQVQQDDFELIQGGEDLKDILDQKKDDDGSALKNSSDIYGEKSSIDTSDLDIGFNITGSGKSSGEQVEPGEKEVEEIILDLTGTTNRENLDLAKKYSLAIKQLEG